MAVATDDVWPVLEAVAGDLVKEQQLPMTFVRLSMPGWRSAIGPWTRTSSSLLQLVLSDEYWRAVRLDPVVLTKLRAKTLAMYAPPLPAVVAAAAPVAVATPLPATPAMSAPPAAATPSPSPLSARSSPGAESPVPVVATAAAAEQPALKKRRGRPPKSPGAAASPSAAATPDSAASSPLSASSAPATPAAPPVVLPVDSDSSSASASASSSHSSAVSAVATARPRPAKRARDAGAAGVVEALVRDGTGADEERLKRLLIGAVEEVNLASVRKLLPLASASLKQEALEVAVQENNTPAGVELVRAILDAPGVQIDALDKRGRSPLNLAICRRCHLNAAALVARGANFMLKQNSYWGDTALHTAALYDDRETLRLLLSHGVDPLTRSSAGQTPLQRMKEWKLQHRDVHETLQTALNYRTQPLLALTAWDVPCRAVRALVCRYRIPVPNTPDMHVIAAGSFVDVSRGSVLPDSHPLAPLRASLFREGRARVSPDGRLLADLILWSDDDVAAILLGNSTSGYSPLQLTAAAYPDGRLDLAKRVLDAVAAEEDALRDEGRPDISGTLRHSSLKEHAYGEIKLRGIHLLSTLVDAAAPDAEHFFDLGSGRGLAVFLVAALTGCRATGVEMEKGRAAFAARVLERLPELRSRVTLQCGDFLAASTALGGATLVYVNNHNMEFIEAQLCIKLLELPNGARVATVDPLPRDHDQWDVHPTGLHGEGAEGEFYSYGNRLERYARSARLDMTVLVRHAGRAATSPRKPGRRGAAAQS